MNLKLKVCGMKYIENVKAVAALNPDFMGFVFYEKSNRFMRDSLSPAFVAALNQQTKTVGVFVNAGEDLVMQTVAAYQLQYVQLHGNESPAYCDAIARSLPVIKSFGVDEHFDFGILDEYTSCSYFLFDTSTPQHGGSGKKFDWTLIDHYKGTTPFFLSGGIGLDDVVPIRSFHHPKLFALDINSRFETEPGVKDISLIESFIQKLNMP